MLIFQNTTVEVFISSCLVVCRRTHVLFMLFVFVAYCGVQCILYCVFLVCPVLSVSLDCQFVIITLVFSNVYLIQKNQIFSP